MMTFLIRCGKLGTFGCNHDVPEQTWSIAKFFAAIMTFPIQHGQIESWKYGHPQNHELEELMQNGIFFAGDEFDIKISFFHFTKWEYFL